jgi:hypothetical protein
MADPIYMLFTHQPTCIVIKSTGTIDGKPNDASTTLTKEGSCFVYTISAELGFRITHGRAWEIIEIQNASNTQTVSVNTFPTDSVALADMREILTLGNGERDIQTRQFGANELVAFKTTGTGPTEIRIYVREYMAHQKGNN